MKDNFSTQAAQYAQFRPTYPADLYDFIKANLNGKSLAWDCATGNGQIAIALAKFVDQVVATDISAKQLANASQRQNISYQLEPAEATSFDSQSLDLITVGQAIHWFKFEAFFAEVKRVLKPDGLFVAVGYGLMKINTSIDPIIDKFYNGIVGVYWDDERRHIEQQYQTIQFPLTEIAAPTLEIVTSWNLPQLLGYLETWSAVQHYIKANETNPLDLIADELKIAWDGASTYDVHFPLIIRAGRTTS